MVGASQTNTGATSVKVGTFGSFPVVKDTPTGPAPLVGGELKSGNVVICRYDGTSLHLVNGVNIYANLNGSPAQPFQVAPATIPTEAVQLGMADGRYAALAGLSTQVFNVANAVNNNEAVALGQANSLYAPTAGNPAVVFSAAPGTSGNEVVNYSQVPLGQSFHIVTSNRAYGTVYTNTSSRTLTVYFIGVVVTTAANATLHVLLNTLTVIEITRYSGNDSLVFDVPAGYTYEIINTQAGINMMQWAELY